MSKPVVSTCKSYGENYSSAMLLTKGGCQILWRDSLSWRIALLLTYVMEQVRMSASCLRLRFNSLPFFSFSRHDDELNIFSEFFDLVQSLGAFQDVNMSVKHSLKKLFRATWLQPHKQTLNSRKKFNFLKIVSGTRNIKRMKQGLISDLSRSHRVWFWKFPLPWRDQANGRERK